MSKKCPSKLRKYLYITFGTLTLVLGALGMFLPVLPTTPFWLLTAYLYLNSSKTLYQRVMNHPIFGHVVRNFTRYKAIPKRIKVVIVTTLWVTIILSCCLVDRWPITLLLLLIALGVTIHILSYKTLTPEHKAACDRAAEEEEARSSL